jgi:hypothetical protein
VVPISVRKEDQIRAVKITTNSLPEYGLVCSEKDQIQVKLFFPKKRDCSTGPLTLYIDKDPLTGSYSSLKGSLQTFLFLSQQAAEEGDFEKAGKFLELAGFASFSSEQKADFMSFLQVLDSFEVDSFPAKAWKIKCWLLVKENLSAKAGIPLFDPQASTESLKRPHDILDLQNKKTT